jgi:hypothetical protein
LSIPPLFVTFTGLDERTDLDRAFDLMIRYPVEFAVLLSRSRQGTEPRYPRMDRIREIQEAGINHLAGHVSGSWAHEIMLGKWPAGGSFAGYWRLQINHSDPNRNLIRLFASRFGASAIAQSRAEEFPPDWGICWLFDRSGGQGVAPEAWPRHPGGDRLVGYAGGIGPQNVLDVIRDIGAEGPYWLDMQSNIRTDDWLDLEKCEAVCEAVFGSLGPYDQVAFGGYYLLEIASPKCRICGRPATHQLLTPQGTTCGEYCGPHGKRKIQELRRALTIRRGDRDERGTSSYESLSSLADPRR